jgi:hypothetical protein
VPHQLFTLRLTERQAEALRALSAAEDLPPEAYAAEVLVKHLYHAHAPERPPTSDPWKSGPTSS